MNYKRFVSLVVFVSTLLSTNAQSNLDEVKQYLNMRLDSIVASWQECNDDSIESGSRTNPTYYRMLTPPVLYESTVKRGLRQGFDMPSATVGGEIDMDSKREVLIDKLLLELYKENPSLVTQTEEQMRSVVSSKELAVYDKAPDIKVNTQAPILASEDAISSLETEYRKPNYWRTSGSVSFDFTQNYVSGNWHAGGENNKTLLTILKLHLNYDDKNKIKFLNTFEAHLGFTTVKSDTLHSVKTNNDMLRLQSNLGYNVAKNLDVSLDVKLQTQMMPSYPSNSPDFVSNFMAPFDASFSLGLNYNRSGKNWNATLFFAPLSSYNYKFVRYGYLASRFGIKEGRQHKEDFGTKLVLKPNVNLSKNITWSARMEFYSTYSRTFFEWENTINMQINRYLKASLLLHTRFDDSAPGLYSDSYGYWQLKEYMTLGISYQW